MMMPPRPRLNLRKRKILFYRVSRESFCGKVRMEYSAEEVAKHKTAQSCWIIINGKVLDVTKWLSKHPGGKSVLLKVILNTHMRSMLELARASGIIVCFHERNAGIQSSLVVRAWYERSAGTYSPFNALMVIFTHVAWRPRRIV